MALFDFAARMFHGFRDRKREEIRNEAFPQEWLRILEKNIPLYSRLPEEERRELQGHILVLLDEKRFEGCAGLEITDEIRVTVAAHASLLLLHRETDYYPDLRSILVYPYSFISKVSHRGEDGVMSEGDVARLGESWQQGYVVLSWRDVLDGAADIRDGHNVALHEFAHQLDTEDGVANGAPLLAERSMYAAWASALGSAYEELRQDLFFGNPTVLDTYGATNPAEFFAVATEAFFERPAEMRRKHPELYEELKRYYRQDPVEYLPEESEEEGAGGFPSI